MAQGTESLQQVRSALEVTRGTAITTMTRIDYPTTCVMTQDVTTITPRELWANFEPTRRAYAGIERVGLLMTGDVTYTDWPRLLNTAVLPLATGSLSDTSAYTWTQAPTAATDTLKSLTVEYSQADLVGTVGWRIPGLVCNELQVTWHKSDVGGDNTGVTYSAAFMTASGAAQITAMTGSLSDRTLINALGTTTVSSINTTGSAHGTTPDPKVIEATLTINNGYQYKDGFDGTNHAASIVKVGPRVATMTIQRYFDDKTELDAYIAKTIRRIQMQASDGLAGAATVFHTMTTYFTGVPTTHAATFSNGMLVANITFEGVWDSALSAAFKFITVNTDSSTLS